jgi:3D (Asp-Asp-Asp) domain-containing protein
MRGARIAIVMSALYSGIAFGEYVNSPEGLNVRTEPNTDSDVVRVIDFGEEVTGKTSDGWMEINDGYVCADFLQEENPLDGLESLGKWRITAYAWTGSPCANEQYPEVGYTIACNSLPIGTEVYIDGVGFRTVEDRGPKWLGSEWCDLYLGEVDECVKWGDQKRTVYLVKDGEDYGKEGER